MGWIVCWMSVGAAALSGASADVLAGLRREHPRLIATSDDWVRLRSNVRTDSTFAAVDATVIADARSMLDQAPLERTLIGRRMLDVSRQLFQRVVTLSYAWRMTGDHVFALRAEAEMVSAATFSDWNPAHFLDVAEATAALAIGYDWCHDALTSEAKAIIRTGLAEKGLRPGLDPSESHNRWHRTLSNWNQVCFAGLTLGALAIAEDDPELAREVLKLARQGIHHGLSPYAPEGVYPEGPSYWVYGTTYQVLMIAGLESSLGTEWGLTAAPGFMSSAGAFVQTIAPSGRFYNFSDSSVASSFEPVLFWFAKKRGQTGLLHFNLRKLQGDELSPANDGRSWFFPLAAVWWPERVHASAGVGPDLPLRWLGRGVNPIAVFRESWTHPNGLYLALKGGSAQLNHAHMDAGSFVLEVDGVRWAVDLGPQQYESLESKGVDLWNREQGSQRWQVFRLNHLSHSTLTIDRQPHRVEGHAAITHFSKGEEAFAIVDLTPVFSPHAASVRRGFKLLPGRRVLVQDELTGLTPGSVVRWQLPTTAMIALHQRRAVLRQEGRVLTVDSVTTAEVEFKAEPADAKGDLFNEPNPGVTILAVEHIAPSDGNLRIGILLTPDLAEPVDPALLPLDDWPVN